IKRLNGFARSEQVITAYLGLVCLFLDQANEIAFEIGVRVKALQLATVLSALPQNRLTAPKRQSFYSNSWFAEDELEDEMPTLNKYVPGDASNK
uniref:Uncharacterized protein n=1 Tax=Panthera leo TaxID=9689 RepID=A0A8C8X6R0_PANLE